MNAVFIGGCGDGRRIVLPDDKTRYEVTKYEPLRSSMNPRPEELVPVERHVYNLFRLHPMTRAVVFAYEALTPTEIMERLLDGYHPPKAPQ